MTRLLTLVAATLIAVTPATASAQAAEQSAPPPPPANPITPAAIDRIQAAVNNPSRLVIDEGKLRIYVEIVAKWPTFAEMAKGYDFKNGPTPRGNPMTHAEFLSMVTPREMYSSAGIRPTEVLQMAVVNWLGQAIIKRGLEAIRNARSDREIAEIRARIDRELAALKGGR